MRSDDGDGAPRDILGPGGEEEWQRLQRLLDFADDAWTAFVFTHDRRQLQELSRRAGWLLRARADQNILLSPKTPEEARTLAPTLLQRLQDTPRGCIWIDALHTAPDWQEAWSNFFLRINERRNFLITHRNGGVLFACPPSFKPTIRSLAPDLWSVRYLVLDLQPLPNQNTSPLAHRALATPDVPGPTSAPDLELALHEVSRLREPHQQHARARALLRAAEGLLAAGSPEQAVLRGREALDLLGPDDHTPGREDAYAILAHAEYACRDIGAARSHIEQALQSVSSEDARRETWLSLLGQITQDLMDWEAALHTYQHLVSLHRQKPSPRDLSIRLDHLGIILQEQGRQDDAFNAFQESLEIRRRLLEVFGESPQTLRDLSISLNHVGMLLHEQGRQEDAFNAFQESLGIRRRLLEVFGESPQTLRDLSISLIINISWLDKYHQAPLRDELLSVFQRREQLYGGLFSTLEEVASMREVLAELERDSEEAEE